MGKIKLVNLILAYIFVFSVFVDIYNGYMQEIKRTETIFPSLYKGIGLVIIILYIIQKCLKGKCNIGVLSFLLILINMYCISSIYWIKNGYIIDLRFELIQVVKLFYPYIIVVFLILNKRNITISKLINFIILYASIGSGFTLLTIFMNISISHAYGFSRVGFFGPGNDLGLMLLMINCLVCYMFLHTSKIRYAVANIVITAVTILIGTVAGIFGSMFIIVCLLLSKYFIKNYNRITKKWQRVYFASIFFIFVPVIIKLIDFIIHYDTYSIRKFSLERLVSGEARNGLKYAVQSYMNTYNIFDYVFGKGISNVWYNVAIILNLNKESRAIELDQYELLSSYGVLFGGILLLCPILLAVYFIKKYIKYQTLFYFWSSIAMALFVFHGFNAGHAYTSVMAMLVVTVFFFSREKILYIQKKQRKYGIL